MTFAGVPAAATVAVSAFVSSLLLTRQAIAYARRRGMLDQPGFRRSHTIPTPRGGGIGLVLASLLLMAVTLPFGRAAWDVWTVAAACTGGALVATVGWIDDHRGLGVIPRLLAQLLAGALLMSALSHATGLAWYWVPVGVLVAAWSINLHNFMDGIDALLGLQLVFVGLSLAWLALVLGQAALGYAALALAAAAAGFLVFNWPPARIFMGDVGSGCGGFLIFALAAMLCARVPLALWPALILCSGFAIDAGLTLAWRMWRGKRWYSPHREHLYQWLARSGYGHMQTGFIYMAWNLLLTVPLAVLAVRVPVAAPWVCVMVYGIGACAWWQGRRICIARGARHAA